MQLVPEGDGFQITDCRPQIPDSRIQIPGCYVFSTFYPMVAIFHVYFQPFTFVRSPPLVSDFDMATCTHGQKLVLCCAPEIDLACFYNLRFGNTLSVFFLLGMYAIA